MRFCFFFLYIVQYFTKYQPPFEIMADFRLCDTDAFRSREGILRNPLPICERMDFSKFSFLFVFFFVSYELRPTFGFAVAAIDGPMVVAVMVRGPFAVVQQTVAALFQRQRAVRAQVELITVIGVRIRLFAVLFRAL